MYTANPRPYTKISSIWIINGNVKWRTTKILGKTFMPWGVRKEFLDMLSKAHFKEWKDQFDLIF